MSEDEAYFKGWSRESLIPLLENRRQEVINLREENGRLKKEAAQEVHDQIELVIGPLQARLAAAEAERDRLQEMLDVAHAAFLLGKTDEAFEAVHIGRQALEGNSDER